MSLSDLCIMAIVILIVADVVIYLINNKDK